MDRGVFQRFSALGAGGLEGDEGGIVSQTCQFKYLEGIWSFLELGIRTQKSNRMKVKLEKMLI